MAIYTGVANGSVQAAVYDQPASALGGQLYGAAETTLVDAVAVDEVNGIGVGIGVVLGFVTSPTFDGINNKTAKLPVAGTLATAFGGVIVRNQTAQTDDTGKVFIGYKRMADVIRPIRAGGRIWVIANNANTAGAAVYWIIKDTTAHGFPIGSFSASALTADAVLLTNATFASVGVAGKPVLIEMG